MNHYVVDIYIYICFTQEIVINENPRVSYNSQISNSLCYTKLNQPILNEDSRREMKRSAQMLMIIMLLSLFLISSACNQVQKYYSCNMFWVLLDIEYDILKTNCFDNRSIILLVRLLVAEIDNGFS